MEIKTVFTADPPVGAWRYVQQDSREFDDACFDAELLEQRGLIDGHANAGRGNTVFFRLQDDQLVLREYQRGGLARRVSKTAYVFLGWDRSRAFREFDMLVHLQKLGLPAARPYACRVLRHGMLYTASIVTHRLSGGTLAERLQSNPDMAKGGDVSATLWRNIGEVIAMFHKAGVFHADLNAHNIMLEDSDRVALIDFDRSRLRRLPVSPTQSGWCLDNINRLERSIGKLLYEHGVRNTAACPGFSECKDQWSRSMSALH